MAEYPLALWILIHDMVEDPVRMFWGDATQDTSCKEGDGSSDIAGD